MSNKKLSGILLLGLLILLGACSSSTTTPTEEHLVIGFSQSGTESNWRKAHTESIVKELEKENYQVLYKNGFMNQEQQIQDIRTFIAYQVDLIIISPLKEAGWDLVLEEAQAADIPVIVVDRDISVTSKELFLTHVGPSFKAEGNRAGLYVSNYFRESPKTEIQILELKGLADTSPTTLRNLGFKETTQRDSRFVISAISGDYIRLKGKEEIQKLIDDQSIYNYDVLFSHSDEMTLGALAALKETDIILGEELIIVTIDGQEEAINALKQGDINCVVECNPHAGWYVANTVKRYFRDETLPAEIYMPETVFSDQGNLASIPTRNY